MSETCLNRQRTVIQPTTASPVSYPDFYAMMNLNRRILLAAAASACAPITVANPSKLNKEEECGLYLAESSIKKDGGWGVFAGKTISTGTLIGPTGIGIPVTDPNILFDNDEGSLEEFLWDSGHVGGRNEAEHVSVALPGIGMLVNYHPLFPNIAAGGLIEETLFDRFSSPAAGSNTAYDKFGFVANQEIFPGQELFEGITKEHWFKDAGLPVREDYEHAQIVVNRMDDYKKAHPEISEAELVDILYRMKHEMMQNYPKTSALLPTTPTDLEQAWYLGVASLNISGVDIKWVKENGMCLDNIEPGKSTIPGGGRGAFATRFIPKGTVIAPAPLVQVMNKDGFQIDKEGNATHQLLLNYCFGHRKSQLLLCPTTHVSLINHKSKGFNSKIRWETTRPSNLNSEGRSYIYGSMDDLKTDSSKASYNSRLMFEFVATEDISKGDEVFLDYGDEWETAWNAHIENWKAPKNNGRIPAIVMNAKQHPLALSNHTSMKYLSYECRLEPFANELLHQNQKENIQEQDYRSLVDVDPKEWKNPGHLLFREINQHFNWWPCEVVDIGADQSSFTVTIYTKHQKKRRQFRQLSNVPRSAIRYADAPYHSDQHLGSSFRHYIPIPDSIFPLRWRDDYVSASSLALGNLNAGNALDDEEEAIKYEKTLRSVKCGMYVAPSNIENAGFGTYTAVPLTGRGIVVGTDVPSIPLLQVMGENWMGKDYVWSGDAFGAEYEGCHNVKGRISMLSVNNGALANMHSGLVNLKLIHPIHESALDRRFDPGAGAFSDYWEYYFQSDHEIGAGEELFVTYGDTWLESRDQFSDVPLSANYEESNSLLASIWGLWSIEDGSISTSAVEDLLNNVIKGDLVVKEHRTQMALKQIQTFADIQVVVERNGTAKFETEARSMEWFEKNGQCLDHIFTKYSTIPQAGQGAFSRRHLKKGDVVVTAPLMVSWGRDTYVLNETFLPHDAQRTQLLMNYQYTHPDSSVMFFPLSTALMINHNSKRMPGGSTPNAELKWSTWNKKSVYFLQRPLEDLKKEPYSTMVLDIVATRHIFPDEEVFIDYGEEWESAWKKHVKEFSSKAPCHGENPCFKSSKAINEMNDDKFNPLYFEWSDDHFTVCKPVEQVDSEDNIFLDPIVSDKNTSAESVSIRWDHVGFNLSIAGDIRTPCLITNANEEEEEFEVIYFLRLESDGIFHHVLRPVRHLKPNMIKFLSKPYKSDLFWNGAFRHEIKIPDAVFPQHWKDLLQDNDHP